MKFKAVGFLDTRIVSCTDQDTEEKQIRDAAKHHHLDLARTLVARPRTDDPIQRLMNMVRRLKADTVVVPTWRDLGTGFNTVIAECEIIEAKTGFVWHRKLNSGVAG